MYDLTLTFDNGPDPDVTPHVLDILAERGIKTTFFVIGEKLLDPERRSLAERARAELAAAFRTRRLSARTPRHSRSA